MRACFMLEREIKREIMLARLRTPSSPVRETERKRGRTERDKDRKREERYKERKREEREKERKREERER